MVHQILRNESLNSSKKELNPFDIADKIAQKIKAKPKQVAGYNSSLFTIEVSNKELRNSLQIDDTT